MREAQEGTAAEITIEYRLLEDGNWHATSPQRPGWEVTFTACDLTQQLARDEMCRMPGCEGTKIREVIIPPADSVHEVA